MTKPKHEGARRFFAAANSGSGFVSYFDEIFSSEEMDGVFILKGGPGTGKSTLLNEAARRFECPNIEAELFHCSSDPRSLDGVILKSAQGRVCILDGTAPHERDARLPGAADEIVNLGEGFDTRILRARKKEILALQRKKSLAYKEAYFNLRLFSFFQERIEAETRKRLKKDATETFIHRYFPSKTEKQTDTGLAVRPIGAFCKDGTVRLDTYERLAKKALRITGDRTECGVLLASLFPLLRQRGYGGLYAPSPLAPSLLDGLLLNGEETALTVADENAQGCICASDFFEERSADEKAAKEKYGAEAGRFLSLAREALSEASAHHFALEAIYTPAMDFERVRAIREGLFEKISAILSPTEIS